MAYKFFIGDAACGASFGFLAGIFAAGLGWNIVLIAGMSCLSSFIFLALQKTFISGLISITFIVTAVFVLGAFYYHFFIAHMARTNMPTGKSVSFLAVVDDEPKQSGKYVLLPVGMEKPYSGDATVFASPGSDVHYGDELEVSGEVVAPKIPGDTAAVFPKKSAVVAAHKGFWLREQMINFKLAVMAEFNKTLLPDQAALLAGETLGGANSMSADLKDAMAASGTSYIVSMYGYKISMIIFFLEEVLREVVARRVRFFILAGAILLFVMMSGGSASVVRAAAMSILVIMAQASGRVFDSRNAIALTAAGVALWDPTLVMQVGLQLSFLSIAGIKYLTHPLKKLFRWDRVGAGVVGWREAVIVAIASLLPIIPIIANAFGDFSLVSFPSNILISLGVLPAMVAGVALALVAAASHYIAFLIAKLAGVILWYQFAVIKVFADIAPLAPLPLSFVSPISLAIYYAALAWLIYYSSEEKYGER